MKKFILFLSILGFVACNNRLPEGDEDYRDTLGTEVTDSKYELDSIACRLLIDSLLEKGPLNFSYKELICGSDTFFIYTDWGGLPSSRPLKEFHSSQIKVKLRAK